MTAEDAVLQMTGTPLNTDEGNYDLSKYGKWRKHPTVVLRRQMPGMLVEYRNPTQEGEMNGRRETMNVL